jgi:hypothetical protein
VTGDRNGTGRGSCLTSADGVARGELREWPAREGLEANGGERRSACCQRGGKRNGSAGATAWSAAREGEGARRGGGCVGTRRRRRARGLPTRRWSAATHRVGGALSFGRRQWWGPALGSDDSRRCTAGTDGTRERHGKERLSLGPMENKMS